MPDRLTCPICRDGLMVEADRELDLHACPTCCFRAPLHIVHLVGAERAELARFRGSLAPDGAEMRALNRRLKDLAYDLLERAHSAERMGGSADDDFDLATREYFRGRALGFRCAMRLVEQLTGLEKPGSAVTGSDVRITAKQPGDPTPSLVVVSRGSDG